VRSVCARSKTRWDRPACRTLSRHDRSTPFRLPRQFNRPSVQLVKSSSRESDNTLQKMCRLPSCVIDLSEHAIGPFVRESTRVGFTRHRADIIDSIGHLLRFSLLDTTGISRAAAWLLLVILEQLAPRVANA
jgi:hypothetical protein